MSEPCPHSKVTRIDNGPDIDLTNYWLETCNDCGATREISQEVGEGMKVGRWRNAEHRVHQSDQSATVL